MSENSLSQNVPCDGGCTPSGVSGRNNASQRCSRCHRAFYCGRECQRKHWLEHKPKCDAYKALQDAHLKTHWVDLPKSRNETCSVCNKSPLENPVVLQCGHGFCLTCAAQNVETAQGIICLTCNQSMPGVSCFDRFEENFVDRCTVNGRDRRAEPEEKEEFLRKGAIQGLDALIAEIGKVPANASSTPLSGEVRAKAITRYMRKKAELLNELGDPKASLLLMTQTKERMRSIVFDELQQDFQQDQENGRQGSSTSGYERAYQRIQSTGLDCQVFVDMEDMARAVELAKFSFTMADAHCKLGEWDKAIEIYKEIQAIPRLDSYDNLYAKTQMGIMLCSLKKGEYQRVCNLANTTLKIDNCTPGVHKSFAYAKKSLGHLPDALEIMNRAILYEAPWDKGNMEENRKVWRGFCDAQRFEEERRRLEERFLEAWGQLIDRVQNESTTGLVSWASLKQDRYDMFTGEDDADIDDIDEQLKDEAQDKLHSATAAAVALPSDDDSTGSEEEDFSTEDDNLIRNKEGKRMALQDAPPEYNRFKLTKEVRKWWQQGDPKYKEFFVRRLKQLAAGDRSRILQKKLIGSKNTPIYETYLEQKSGFRILWTEDNQKGILIWYVSPHDRVSTYMKRIDDAETRSSRQLTPATELPSLVEALNTVGDEDERDLDADKVILDPYGDTPLKLYVLNVAEIGKFADEEWLPPLYLTTEERKIVEKPGTVLLLGRSGTGKTVCICNRIHYDLHFNLNDATFSQVFIARSQRICHYVQETVGPSQLLGDDGTPRTTFMTFKKFMENCEDQAYLDAHPFTPRDRVDYSRFKKVFTNLGTDLDSLIVWTQIRSFIKGSLEAVMLGRDLTLEEYLDTEVIGSRRCRLSTAHREEAYEAYIKYEKYLREVHLWDDCDRMARLLRTIKSNPPLRESLSRRRVYVDEIQDYTQAEIALFFLLCDRGGLFLAGDPAQSVVEGVEFRFEEVRAVPYRLFPDDSRAIPEKPLSVTRNFRSHAGILNIAAQVLDKMFLAFPGSAKELPKDRGLFVGPRPGIFQEVSPRSLPNLVDKFRGVVLLCMNDEDVEKVESLVGKETVTLSIRDSKGLEFPDIMIVDFFKNLPDVQQKPWRLLLQGKLDEARQMIGFPEIEAQLKQLYTAITRCSKRLFFLETGPSDSGDAFVRWLVSDSKQLVKQTVADTHDIIKTRDEWNADGVAYATYAESAEDTVRSLFWLQKAVPCFREANEKNLERMVDVHRQSVELRQEYQYKSLSEDLDKAELETVTVRQLEMLAEVGLLLEARRLCDVILPLLDEYTRSTVEQRLIPLLPEFD